VTKATGRAAGRSERAIPGTEAGRTLTPVSAMARSTHRRVRRRTGRSLRSSGGVSAPGLRLPQSRSISASFPPRRCGRAPSGVSVAISVRGTGRHLHRGRRLEAHLLQLDRRRREHEAVGHRLRLLALGDAVDGKPLVRRLGAAGIGGRLPHRAFQRLDHRHAGDIAHQKLHRPDAHPHDEPQRHQRAGPVHHRAEPRPTGSFGRREHPPPARTAIASRRRNRYVPCLSSCRPIPGQVTRTRPAGSVWSCSIRPRARFALTSFRPVSRPRYQDRWK
jgi:hypothetical protein